MSVTCPDAIAEAVAFLLLPPQKTQLFLGVAVFIHAQLLFLHGLKLVLDAGGRQQRSPEDAKGLTTAPFQAHPSS